MFLCCRVAGRPISPAILGVAVSVSPSSTKRLFVYPGQVHPAVLPAVPRLPTVPLLCQSVRHPLSVCVPRPSSASSSASCSPCSNCSPPVSVCPSFTECLSVCSGQVQVREQFRQLFCVLPGEQFHQLFSVLPEEHFHQLFFVLLCHSVRHSLSVCLCAQAKFK